MTSTETDAATSPRMETVEGLRALVVPVDSEVRDVVLTRGSNYYLSDLRTHTGADMIEHVRGPLRTSLWVDEEGAVVEPPRPPNRRIDGLLLRPDGWSIRGDVVVTGGVDPLLGDPVSLPWTTATFLREVFAGILDGGTTTPQEGRCYTWSAPELSTEPMHVQISRVADDGWWADIVVTQRGGGQWAKRQPLGRIRLTPTALDVDAFLVGGR